MRERRNHLTLVGLIVAALIGVAPDRHPRLSVPRARRSASISRAGSRSCWKPNRPRVRRSRTRTSIARSTSCGTASTSSASPSPRCASRATTRSSSSWPASPIRRSGELIGRPPSSSSTTSSRTSSARRSAPRARRHLAAVRPPGRQGRLGSPNASTYYLFGRTAGCWRDLRTREEALFTKHPRVPPAARCSALLATPSSSRAWPAKSELSAELTSGGPYYYLFRYQPNNAENPIPEMTGGHLKSSGTRHDFDQFGQPIVRWSSRARARTASRTSRGGCGSAATSAALRSTSRSCSTARSVVAADRPERPTLSDGQRLGADREHRQRSARRRTSRSCCRPVPAGLLPAGRAHRRLRHARQGLAPGGEDRRDHRPARRRALPDRLLPAAGDRRRHRPRHLRRVHVRGDPHPQRHADAARLRRPDPHDRRRADANVVIFERIKEKCGPGSRREPRSRPATRRASIRSSTRTSSRRSRPRAVRGRDRPGEGFALMLLVGTVVSVLTAVVATRDARAARRLPLVRQPALHGRRGQGSSGCGSTSTAAAAVASGSRSRRWRSCSASSPSPSRA